MRRLLVASLRDAGLWWGRRFLHSDRSLRDGVDLYKIIPYTCRRYVKLGRNGYTHQICIP